MVSDFLIMLSFLWRNPASKVQTSLASFKRVMVKVALHLGWKTKSLAAVTGFPVWDASSLFQSQQCSCGDIIASNATRSLTLEERRQVKSNKKGRRKRGLFLSNYSHLCTVRGSNKKRKSVMVFEDKCQLWARVRTWETDGLCMVM